jgi:hypothetical protein
MRGGAVPAIHGRRDSPPVPRRRDDRPFSENCRGARAAGEAMSDKRYGKRRVKSVPGPMSWPGTQAASPVPRAIRRRASIRVGALVPHPVPSGASRRARRCRKRRGAGNGRPSTRSVGTGSERPEASAPRAPQERGGRPAISPPSPLRLPAVSSPGPLPLPYGPGPERHGRRRAPSIRFSPPPRPGKLRRAPPARSLMRPLFPPHRKAVLFPAPAAVSRSPLPLPLSPAFSGCRGGDRNGWFQCGAARLRPPPRARPPSGRS